MNYYHNKKVLITGADGFIGSHLTERMVDLGANVITYTRSTSTHGTISSGFRNISHIEKKLYNSLTGNLASQDSIYNIAKEKPDIIFHLAADAYVPKSFSNPIEVLQTNLIGTLNVLHAAMEIPTLENVICTSSSEIYGCTIGDSISEDHPMFPSSPYAASKVAADRYCYAYQNTYGLPISTIRPFNTYGPRHTYDVIPKFIKLALENKPITIHGDGLQTRDFLYVDDLIRGFLLIGEKKESIGKFINIGSGQDYPILFIAQKIKKLTNSSSEIIHIEKRTSEVEQLKCNYSLANKLLNWSPSVSIDDGLKKNIDWELKNNYKHI